MCQQHLHTILSADQSAFDLLNAVIKQGIDQLNKVKGSKATSEVCNIDFSSISVPTNTMAKASVQVDGLNRAISTDACAKGTTSLSGNQMEDVTFTSPPSTSTPCPTATRSFTWVIRAPKRYGTSSVWVMWQPKQRCIMISKFKVLKMQYV